MTVNPQDRSQFPFMDPLEAGADVFRREALALPDDAFVPLPDESTYIDGKWEVCLLKLDQYADDFPPGILEANRARCPETWARIQALDGLVVAGIMRLSAGGRIRRHVDRRDDDVVRVHLALQLAEGEQSYWAPGTARLMDIRQSHQAKNDGDRDRVTLCCDFRMPFAIPEGVIPPWGEPVEKARPYLFEQPSQDLPQPEDILRAPPELEAQAKADGRMDVQPQEAVFADTPKVTPGGAAPAVAGGEDPADAPTEKA